jgi:hypothetical protein
LKSLNPFAVLSWCSWRITGSSRSSRSF